MYVYIYIYIHMNAPLIKKILPALVTQSIRMGLHVLPKLDQESRQQHASKATGNTQDATDSRPGQVMGNERQAASNRL